jgi:hypothetical protein
MATVDISPVHMAPVDRSLHVLELKSWLSPNRPLGIGLRDRSTIRRSPFGGSGELPYQLRRVGRIIRSSGPKTSFSLGERKIMAGSRALDR